MKTKSSKSEENKSDKFVLESKSFDKLIEALTKKGYQILGPTVRDRAIVYDELKSASELPIGWTDEQNGGAYRLKKRKDGAYFGYAAGPHSWKKFLYPQTIRLWRAERANGSFNFLEDGEKPPKFAFIGIRSCELHAIAIQDKVFLGGSYVDPFYQSRREQVFTVAVNCGEAGGTCFCASMNTGPIATSDFDLALTEILEDGNHYFVVEAGSKEGVKILEDLPLKKADEQNLKAADQIVSKAAKKMGRAMDTTDIKDLLYNNYDHPRWEDVAGRCLTCANCTMVCPTCFCSTVEDVTDLAGRQAERRRKWDSCFTMDFSFIHGGSVRQSPKSRYRQWMIHKLATWIDQYGVSGCVGCGRCITWCPVGIDITEEVRAIRENKIKGKIS